MSYIISKRSSGQLVAIGIIIGLILYQRKRSIHKSSLLKQHNVRSIKADGKRRVLLIGTGSVAAVKIPELVQQLVQKEIFVDLVLTKSCMHFMKVEYHGLKGWDLLNSIQILRSVDGTHFLEIWKDKHEWETYSKVGDVVVHIDLVKRNHLLLVAPICANVLASLVYGFAGNLATSVMRAWHYDIDQSPVQNKPFLIAPAMNTFMWHQSITKQQLETAKTRGVCVIDPVMKTLACGDKGLGAMADVNTIVDEVIRALDMVDSQK